MLNARKFFALVVVLAAFAVSAIAYPHLPALVPTHWGITGEPNGYGSRLRGALMLPLMMLAVWIVFALVPRYDRPVFARRGTSGDGPAARPEYDVLIGIVLALFLAIHVFAIGSALGVVAKNRQPMLIATLLSFGMIAVGNYLPRVTRRNAFIGVRLPWAYASEDIWRRTQRVGGYSLVAAGVTGLIGVIALPAVPLIPLFVALVLQTVFVVVYSYRIAHSGTGI
jgi:immunity protein, SdpI family